MPTPNSAPSEIRTHLQKAGLHDAVAASRRSLFISEQGYFSSQPAYLRVLRIRTSFGNTEYVSALSWTILVNN